MKKMLFYIFYWAYYIFVVIYVLFKIALGLFTISTLLPVSTIITMFLVAVLNFGRK